MAREATITADQVASAAASLKATGQRVTLRAVRDILGGGSMTTIQKLLAGYKDAEPIAATPSAEMPASVINALRQAIEQATAQAQANLLAELGEARQALQDITAEAERTAAALAEADERILATTCENATLLERLADAEHQAEKRAAEWRAGAESWRAELERERAAAERARTELAKVELRLEALPQLQDDLKEARKDHQEALERANRSERIAAAADATTAAQAAELGRRQAELGRLQAELGRLQADLAETRKSLADEQKARQATTAELASARTHVTAQQVALDAAKREADLLAAQIREHRAPKHSAKTTTPAKAAD